MTLSDIEIAFNVNLDPLKAAIYSAGQQITAFVTQTKQTATGLKEASAAAQGFKNEADGMTASLSRSLAVENAQKVILDQMKVSAEKAGISLQQFGTAATQAGRAMTMGITAPLLGLGAAALGTSQQIQVAMNSIRAETGATGEKLAGLGKSFRDVASQVPQSMEEVGRAVAQVAQRTNLSGAALTGLSTQFLTLARVTGGQVTPLIASSTKVFAQWGVQVKDQQEVLNQFLRTHEATGIGVQDLTDKILRFGPALKTAGLSLQDAEGLLGAFNKQGVVGDKALTALNTTFSKWAKAGITDAHAALVNLIAAVQKAPTAFAALKVATDAGMGGRGGADFVNAVRTGGVEFQKFLDVILSGKETVKKAGDDTLTVANQFAILEKKIALAAEPLGRFIAEKLKDLSAALTADTPQIEKFGNAFAGQRESAKNAELGLALFTASLGPLIYSIGRATQGWAAFTVIMKAGTATIRAAGLALLEAALPVTALAAVALFATAYFTNFDHLWDRLRAGWEGLWGDIQELGHSSLSKVADDWHAGVSAIIEDWHAGIARIRGEQAAPPVTAQGIQASGFAQHLGVAPPVLPPTFGPRAGGLGGGNAGNAPNIKAETDAHREMREALLAESKAQEVLNLMKAGYNKHQADLIARYGPATAGIMKQTEALDAQALKIEATNKANIKAVLLADQLHAKVLAMSLELQGHAPTRVPQTGVRVEGADAAHQSLVAGAQKEADAMAARLKAFHEQQAKAGAELATLGKQIDAMLQGQATRHDELAGATKQDATAQEMFNKALATGDPRLQDKATLLLANTAANDALAESQKALIAQYEQDKGVIDAILAVELRHQELQDQLGGAGKQLTATQKALNKAYEDGDPFLVAWAQAAADAAAADDLLIGKHKTATTILEKLNSLSVQARETIDSFGAKITLTAKGQEMLNEAMKNGDPAAIKAAQDFLALAKAADAAIEAHKELAREQTALQKGLQKTAQFMNAEFTKGFANLMKAGFKGFFSSILGDLDQLLKDMAAKILAAKLTELLLGGGGAANAEAGATGSGGGGAGGLLGILGGLVGGLFGGGGGGDPGKAFDTVMGSDPIFGAGPQGFALGGSMFAGEAGIVGERGRELWIPDRSGKVVPNNQLGAGGGGSTTHIHQNFNISTPDVAGFKKSQSQLMADSLRLAQMHQVRNGS